MVGNVPVFLGAGGQPAFQYLGWGGLCLPSYDSMAYVATPLAALPTGDVILPLGDHLLAFTKEKILRGKFVDVFFHFLPHELEKKDKEDLYEKDKAKLKKHKIDRNWANWFPGSLCRSFFPCTTLEGCCFVAICRYSVQVIHRVFRLVLDPL